MNKTQAMRGVFIVTGAIASGKTVLLSKMRKMGFLTLNTDKIARSILISNSTIQEKIIHQFPIYKNSLGHFDISIFTEKILHDKAALSLIEELVHPMVRTICNNFVINVRKQSNILIALEIPLFIEALIKDTGHYLYEKIIITYSCYNIRAKRALQRDNMTKAKFDAITSRQTTDNARLQYADYIVCCENDESVNSFLGKLIEGNSFRYRNNWPKC